ncbi:hypothetical protein B5X24_HaOG214063 [Helicoverpa armigera]|uniref:Uncharacterized protein n=1 Tax=Helicoverpa armigera TaxID=29058 RepID=A0A2W1BE14_HELAM|nr:hypothetical protein B5X24_HaOG214063 [Helicoverpa armigera]
MYDPPHLLKCFRNLFLKYNIQCTTEITSKNKSGIGVAKWSQFPKGIDQITEDVKDVPFLSYPCDIYPTTDVLTIVATR